jgi:DNA-binding GntR family transcriptional regulator
MVDSNTPLGPPPTTTLRAYLVASLRDAIITGRFKPGDRLNESKLARQYNMSRIPVREALQQLQEQGLVMNHPRRGMFVNMLSDEDCQKINSVRIILESEALKLCRARLTPAAEHHLVELVEKMEGCEAAAQIDDAAALDLEFHRAVWGYSGNAYLEKTLDSLVPVLFAHQALEYLTHDRARRWPLNHHRQLLEVILGKSGRTAEEAMVVHLRHRYVNPERYSSLALAGLGETKRLAESDGPKATLAAASTTSPVPESPEIDRREHH